MAINLQSLEYPQRFEEFCKDLLAAEFSRFYSFSGTDEGIDGYDSNSQTIFQFYFPEGAPRKEKVRRDLEKASRHPCKTWILLLPKDSPIKFTRWLLEEQQELYSFKIERPWGRTPILKLLRKHPGVKESYFPSEVKQALRKLAKGKRPRSGDAAPGLEVTSEQREELREWIKALAEQEAKKKRRKLRDEYYRREYNEFNAKFELSEFSKLPGSKFGEARKHLEEKFYARRGRETKRERSQRRRDGIHAIKTKLRMTNTEYKQHLLLITGKDSTKEMSLQEMEKVFREFRRMQQEAEAQTR
ncbi:MAG: hypothetical protein IH847_08365 [Acidobacteria bacterium]|nr:hypothetical protein [Acidobacteriota bacterium]